MGNKDILTPRQAMALSFVALLSPIVRRMPRSLIMLSGGASALAVVLAAIPCGGVFLLLRRGLMAEKPLPEALELSLGKFFARALMAAVSLWLIFYCGFLLHSGAHRLVSTVYPQTSPEPFIIISAMICLIPALGGLKILGRGAMILRPLLLTVTAAVALLSVGAWDFTGVMDVTARDALPLAESAAVVLNTLSLPAYFLFSGSFRGEIKKREVLGWCAAVLTVTGLLCLSCLGVFGVELTEKLNYPFFMLVRDISVFDSLARVEALVVALWPIADIMLCSALLRIACGNLSRLRGREISPALAMVCVGLALAVALAIPRDILSLGRISETIAPPVNAAIIFGAIPLGLIIGRLRRKI